MTALDIWFLICIGFVAMALFEYAILLGIKYGKHNKANNNQNGEKFDKIAEARCRLIDYHAMRVFIALHVVLVGIYFFVLSQLEPKLT